MICELAILLIWQYSFPWSCWFVKMLNCLNPCWIYITKIRKKYLELSPENVYNFQFLYWLSLTKASFDGIFLLYFNIYVYHSYRNIASVNYYFFKNLNILYELFCLQLLFVMCTYSPRSLMKCNWKCASTFFLIK